MRKTTPSLSADQVEVIDSTALQKASSSGYPIGVQSIFVEGQQPLNVFLPVMAPFGLVYFQNTAGTSTCLLPPGASVALGQSISVITQNNAQPVKVYATPPDKLGVCFNPPLANVGSYTVNLLATFTWTGGADEGGQGYWMLSQF
ncbi:MAG: hypothetical protein EBS90_11020 [Betaproteobacteria bacterium]|nr:hypothetical protein [Betaproteobacteria bacterium]